MGVTLPQAECRWRASPSSLRSSRRRLVAVVTAGLGRADTRIAVVSDPRDILGFEDIEQVRVEYDSAGRLALAMRFYDPLSTPTSSGWKSAMIKVGKLGNGTCLDAVSTFIDLYEEFPGSVFIEGFSGSLRIPRQVSGDNAKCQPSLNTPRSQINHTTVSRPKQCYAVQPLITHSIAYRSRRFRRHPRPRPPLRRRQTQPCGRSSNCGRTLWPPRGSSAAA
jgi:hypothetical protein